MAIPTRREFLTQVEQLIARRFPLVKIQRHEEDFSLSLNGHLTSLENLYRMLTPPASPASPASSDAGQDPSAFDKRLADQVDHWVLTILRAAEGLPDQTATFEELRLRIYPMLLSPGRRDVVGQAMITQPLLDGLIVGYGVDSDRTISYVPQKAFDGWQISLDELHETALENLMQRSQVLQAHAAADEGGKVNLVIIQSMDGYDASRILLPTLHDHLRQHLGSPFVAGVPNRDILVCFRDEPDNVQRLRNQIRQDFQTMPHQVSDNLFLITPDGIAPYA